MRSIEQKAGTTLIEELNREQPRVSVDGDVDADESWINFAFVCYAANTTRLNRTTTEQLARYSCCHNPLFQNLRRKMKGRFE